MRKYEQKKNIYSNYDIEEAQALKGDENEESVQIKRQQTNIKGAPKGKLEKYRPLYQDDTDSNRSIIGIFWKVLMGN